MARPGRPRGALKQGADYFPHRGDSSSENDAIVYLESKFGFMGYAFAYKLLEQLCLAENFEIYLSEIKRAMLCKKLSLTDVQFEQLLFESTRDEIKLFSIESGILSSNWLKEVMKPLLLFRERDRKAYIPKGKQFSDNEKQFSDTEKPLSRVEERKEKKSKVTEDHFFYLIAKNLFKEKTKIENPSFEKHLFPILEFFTAIPENLTISDIETCIRESFEGLSDLSGIRMDFLCNNISQKIAAKRESLYIAAKAPLLVEAGKMRKEAAKAETEAKELDVEQKIADLTKRFETNLAKFSAKQKAEIKDAIEKKDWVWAEGILLSKMEELEPSL